MEPFSKRWKKESMISLKVKYLVKVFLATMAPDMHRISVLGYAVLAIKLNNS